MSPAVAVAVVAAASVAVTVACAPLVLMALRSRQVIDVPSDRSSHVVPTPRGGGIACLLGIVVAVLIAPVGAWSPKLLILCVGGALAVLGLADDVRSLRVSQRLVIQIALGLVASCWLLVFDATADALTVILVVVATVWIVGYVNAFNFMDGINGLAGAAAAVSGITFALVGLGRDHPALAIGGAAMAGAALGFLPWNVPRARFFLGDVGSYLLGGATAILVVLGARSHLPIEALLAPEAVFLADTGWTLVGRIRRHEPWTTAHRNHVYQRLQQSGWSHARTTASVTLMMVAVSALGALSLTRVTWARLLGDSAGILLLGAYLAAPFLVRRVAPSPR